MPNLVLFLFFLTSSANFLNAQQDSSLEEEFPHFIMAYTDSYPRDSMDYRIINEPQYYKILYRLEKDSLYVVDTLNAQEDLKLNLIVNYPEQGLLYLEENKLWSNRSERYLSILDYKDSLIIRRHRSNNKSSATSGLALINKNGITIVTNELSLINDTLTRFGVDKYFNRYAIEAADYQNRIESGYPVHQIQQPWRLELWYFNDDYDHLKLPVHKDQESIYKNKNYERLMDYKIQLPDSLKGIGNDAFVILINNNQYFIGYLARGDNYKKGHLRALIYDKKSHIWQRFEHKNLNSTIMNFQDWLIGFEFFPNPDPDSHEKITSPFLKRNEYITTFGLPKVTRAKYTGTLYIYHIPSQTYSEWDTGNIDSEIIFISPQNILYYRVFDEIRSVELDINTHEINWSTDTLIIKDQERVPNIHWMFLSKKMEMQEVWIE